MVDSQAAHRVRLFLSQSVIIMVSDVMHAWHIYACSSISATKGTRNVDDDDDLYAV